MELNNISPNSKQVYFLVLYLKMGGIEVITTNLANSLCKQGYNVTIISLLKDNDLFDHIDNRIKVEYIGNFKQHKALWFKGYWRLLLFKLIKKIRSINNSIIISTRDEYNILVSSYSNKNNLKIAWLHHDYIGKPKLIKHFKYKYNNIDKFIILTEDIKEEIHKIIKPFNKTTELITIPNFLPVSTPNLNDNEKSEINILKESNYCIAVGRLSPEKGFSRLIDLWSLIKNSTSGNLKLYIIGAGPEEGKLKDKIIANNLSQDVYLLGAKSNSFSQELSKHAIAYCMTSYTEAFPLVLLEALKAGTPQIAYDVRVGPRNLIINNITGFLIPENNQIEYSNCIVNIYNNPELRKKLSLNSQKRAILYSENVIRDKWEHIVFKTKNKI